MAGDDLDVAAAAEMYLRNPYEVLDSWDAARRVVAELDARGAYSAEFVARRLVDAKKGREARRVVMAFSYHWNRTALLKEPKRFSEQVHADANLPRAAIDPVVRAASRCAVELERFVGESKAALEVKASTWRSCFGASLYEAINLRDVIHGQNVLVLGESGTGKEILARAIQRGAITQHDDPPMVSVNVATTPDTLIDSALFGHVKGAYSEANEDRVGCFEEAHNGTLFLDEIADLPLQSQPKLLRATQERRVTPLGTSKERPADARIVAATSQALRGLCDQERFRIDLFERLAGIVIVVPPLRDRREDIGLIADAFLDRVLPEDRGIGTATDGNPILASLPGVKRIAAAEFVARINYDWPGNVRRLENVLRRLLMGYSEEQAILDGQEPMSSAEFTKRIADCDVSEDELVSWYRAHVLSRCDGNMTKAATMLGVNRVTLARAKKS